MEDAPVQMDGGYWYDGGDYKRVHINAGASSMQICLILKNAGFFNDAAQFNIDLSVKGYDKNLQSGDFNIPEDISRDELMRVLTRQ
jgi:cell division protein YceG involved in septum cleavage